ncbi:MAG: Glyoxalase/Bleomycin resistance protein/Dioxygenase superfamily [Chloroflexi bacterium]|nr:Glyoxalase/Bleomycin resistance protein/Dioxygenase superfamily [Chloroflexota bacterium]
MQEPERVREFYCNVLGGTVLRQHLPQLTVTLGASAIALFGDEDRGLPYRPNNRGIPRFAFEVASEDFPKLIRRLQEAGRVFDGPDGSDGDDAAHVWLHDPEGNYLEFVDRGRPKEHADEEIELVRIDHVEYEDTDLNETAEWYQAAMGFDVAGRGLSPEGHPYLDLKMPTSGQMIRFHRVKDPSVVFTEAFHGHHLAFNSHAEEYEEACEALVRYGVPLVHRPVPDDQGGRTSYFQDPHGHRISLGPERSLRAGELASRRAAGELRPARRGAAE